MTSATVKMSEESARHHEQRAFEHRADDGGEDDAPTLEREGGRRGEEREVGEDENGPRHVEVVTEDGELESEGRRHVEQRHVGLHWFDPLPSVP
jgi:hypothetical protein